MTATYTNQPGVRPIDTVRFEIDDKDTIPETDAMLSDEEIQYLIDSSRHILLAAASAAEAVATKFSDEASEKTVDDFTLKFSGGGQAESYTARAKSLRDRAYRTVGGKVYAGGISESDKRGMEQDTDRVDSAFTIGMDDNVAAGERGISEF